MDRGAWQAAVYRDTTEATQQARMHACMWSSGRALSSSDNPGSPHSPTPGPGDSASVDSHMAPPPPPTAAALI